jgi:excisionase family DNA binding protein
MKSDEILNVPQAAALMGCSDVWVIKMIRSGELEGFRLSGRAWAVSRKSVEKSIEEYQRRDPSRPGRKREGSRTVPQAARAKWVEGSNTEARKVTGYYSGTQAAELLGCSVNTVGRAARRADVGVWLVGGRLAALSPADVEALKPHIHDTSGNPNWIATRGNGPHARFKPPRGKKSR